MRKAAPFFVLMLAFLMSLTSCSGSISSGDLAAEIQKSYTDSGSITMNVSLTADYGGRVYKFFLKYAADSTGGTLTILEPENISGIEAHISEDGATLSYDGAEVFTGELTPDGLSPIDALPAIVSAWRGGLITESVYESFDGTDCVAAVFRITDDVNLRTLFDKETYLPVSAELISSGYTVISCSFYDVVLSD